MKSVLFIVLIPFLFVTFSHAQLQPKMSGSHFCSMKKSQMTQLPNLMETLGTTGVHTFDVLDYTLNLNLYHCYTSPYPNDFKASNTITFKADTLVNSIQLNAVSSSLVIDSVRLAGSTFTQVNDTLTVFLNRYYNAGEIAQVKI